MLQALLTRIIAHVDKQLDAREAAASQGGKPQTNRSTAISTAGRSRSPSAASQDQGDAEGPTTTQRAALDQATEGECPTQGQDAMGVVWGVSLNPAGRQARNKNAGVFRDPSPEPSPQSGTDETRRTPPRGMYAAPYVPLGWHLAPEVRAKIQKGEYVDIFSLLLREPEPDPKGDQCPCTLQSIKTAKVERNWQNWVCGFIAYAGVVLQKYNTRGEELFKYMDIIHRLYLTYGRMGWARYDEQFRMRSSVCPQLSWCVLDQELWSQLVVNEWEQDGSQPPGFPAKQRVQPTGICYAFNTQGSCLRQECTYQHACSSCGGGHAVKLCGNPKGGRNKKSRHPWRKQGGGSGSGPNMPTARQGAKPN